MSGSKWWCLFVVFFFFNVYTLLNWSQVRVQVRPGYLRTSTCSQGDQEPSYISSWGTKRGVTMADHSK